MVPERNQRKSIPLNYFPPPLGGMRVRNRLLLTFCIFPAPPNNNSKHANNLSESISKSSQKQIKDFHRDLDLYKLPLKI